MEMGPSNRSACGNRMLPASHFHVFVVNVGYYGRLPLLRHLCLVAAHEQVTVTSAGAILKQNNQKSRLGQSVVVVLCYCC